MKKRNNYWTLEKCLIDAQKYQTKAEWCKHSRGAYKRAYKNNWLSLCCKHMIQLINDKKYWTKECCILDAKNYNSIKEWQNKSYGYTKARKNNWLHLCTKLMKLRKKWDLINCQNEAKKYTSKSEWFYKSRSSYYAALRNNWLESCSKHMIPLGHKYKRLIYLFLFPDNYVYVGLTYHSMNRKKYHLSNIKSPVYNHILKTELLPEYKELTKYIDYIKASKLEGVFQKHYLNLGYFPLFTKKAGSLGGSTYKKL